MFKDWKQHWRNGRRAGAALMKANPKMVNGFLALSAGQNGNGTLDAKTKEMIALAVAVTTRCDSCIPQHAQAPRKARVTEPALTDAPATAPSPNAGAACGHPNR